MRLSGSLDEEKSPPNAKQMTTQVRAHLNFNRIAQIQGAFFQAEANATAITAAGHFGYVTDRFVGWNPTANAGAGAATNIAWATDLGKQIFERTTAQGVPTTANSLWYNSDTDNLMLTPDGVAGEIVLTNADGKLIRTGAPTTPVESDTWYDTADDRIKYRDGAGVNQTLVTQSDIGDVMKIRGTFSAAAGQRPDQVTPAITNIEAGNVWVVSVGGTLTGIGGDDVLAPGDLLMATVDAPTTAADYTGIEMNRNINLNNMASFERVTQALTAGNNTVTATVLTNVAWAGVLNAANQQEDLIDITRASNTSYTIGTLSAIAGATTVIFGTL